MTIRQQRGSLTQLPVVGALVAAVLSVGFVQEPTPITIEGSIAGASGRHTVYVALWSERGFLETPVQSVRIPAGNEMRYRFVTAPGRWAVSAFEDRNENGLLDMGVFGPKEPNGFWRPFRGHHKPRFEEVALTVDDNLSTANIVLR